MKKSIITVVGKDTVGIIAKVCTYLAENGIKGEIVIPTGVTEIPARCFYNCSYLTSIILHSGQSSPVGISQ